MGVASQNINITTKLDVSNRFSHCAVSCSCERIMLHLAQVGASVSPETKKEYLELKKQIKSSRSSHSKFDSDYAKAMKPSKPASEKPSGGGTDVAEEVDDDVNEYFL